ncbi:MAG TPA: nodulation protein NfeD [Candidatus Polarisedimenticolaceae bacterium]|nr:nodulation protein NfeD [Candidatus Polarisedimenticolaceae bacterium]
MSRLAGLLLAVCLGVSARAAAPSVRLVTFDTEITHASARRITDAIDAAEANGDALVLIEMDTPGGEVDATEDVVKRMLASKVPIAVWVGPSGARAASGGFYLLIAADVAAMAPGTRTGAAAVIYGMGKSDEGDVLLKKMTNDLAALARSIAEHRGRDPVSCEKAVVSAESFTDRAAVAGKIVDLVAKDRADLLKQLDGRVVKRFDGTTVTLALASPEVIEKPRTGSDNALEFLANPTVAFLLFIIGLAGLYAEFNHPGAWVPGLVGVLALILFAVGARNIPVSVVGIGLVLAGLVLFVLELKIASHGLLAALGTVAVVLGSVLLFPGSGGDLRPPLAVVLPGSLTLAAICFGATRLAVKARRTPLATGVEGLRGEIGVVQHPLEPEGTVFVHGEIWQAKGMSGPLPAGARVRVVGVHDLVVDVESVDAKV